MGETFKSVILIGILDSSENSSIPSTAHKSEAKPIEIVGQHDIYSVAFFVDGKHFVSGGEEGKVRRWRVEDGKEAEAPIDAGSEVSNITVSGDGKWVVSGVDSGELTVWDAVSQKKVTGWQAHNGWVGAVDISPDETRIATGSGDSTACVWSLSTGQRLLGPWTHHDAVVTVKFSPDARLVATATRCSSVRVYDTGCQAGRLPIVDIPIWVADTFNQSLVWVSNSQNLFALSLDGKINCLDVSTGTTLSSWTIHGNEPSPPRCIALASNDTIIATSAGSSVSLWDTTTHKQIGSIINHTEHVLSMAISASYDLVIGGGKAITVLNIRDVLPSSYYEDVSALA